MKKYWLLIFILIINLLPCSQSVSFGEEKHVANKQDVNQAGSSQAMLREAEALLKLKDAVDAGTVQHDGNSLYTADNDGVWPTNAELRLIKNIKAGQQLGFTVTSGAAGNGNSNSSYGVDFSSAGISDQNSGTSYNVFWRTDMWGKEGTFFQNQQSSIVYGFTLSDRIATGSGYWLGALNVQWDADKPNPTEFMPSVRLEYGHDYSPDHSLVIGSQYGLRTYHVYELKGLHYDYFTTDFQYRIVW